MSSVIPFNRPGRAGREIEYVAEAVEQGHTACGGPFTARVSELLVEALGAEDVLLTTSCTDALEMTALLLDVGPGDTVIVPSFTFVSTALAFARQGATIRFCDIERSTLGLDPDDLTSLMDESVRAVVPVHYAGVGCRLAEISSVTEAYPRAEVIEDNAHGLFATYRDVPLGSFGRFSTLSFHETKNFICGEGGALVLNDPADVDRAHVLLDKGTNRRQFLLGEVDKYSWVDVGSSFGLSEMLAAFLFAQLEEREEILRRRAWATQQYDERLEAHAAPDTFSLPSVPEDRTSAHHMYYVLLPDRRVRDAVLKSMKARDIHPTFHYVPLHSSPGGRRFGEPRECPVTDEISGRLLRLPYYNDLSAGDIDRVVAGFLGAVAEAS